MHPSVHPSVRSPSVYHARSHLSLASAPGRVSQCSTSVLPRPPHSVFPRERGRGRRPDRPTATFPLFPPSLLPSFPPSLLPSFPPAFLRLHRGRTANLTQVCFRPASELSCGPWDIGCSLFINLAFWSSALASRKQTVVTLPCPRYSPIQEASKDWPAYELLPGVDLDDTIRVGTAWGEDLLGIEASLAGGADRYLRHRLQCDRGTTDA